MYSTVTSHVILHCMKRSLHKCSLALRHIIPVATGGFGGLCCGSYP